MHRFDSSESISYLNSKPTSTNIPKPPSPLRISRSIPTDSYFDHGPRLERKLEYDLFAMEEDPMDMMLYDTNPQGNDEDYSTPIQRKTVTRAKKAKSTTRSKKTKSQKRIKENDIRFIKDDELLDPSKISPEDLKKVPREVRSLLGPINKLKPPQTPITDPSQRFLKSKSGRVIVPPRDYWRGQVKKTDAFGNFIEVSEGSPSVQTMNRRRRVKQSDEDYSEVEYEQPQEMANPRTRKKRNSDDNYIYEEDEEDEDLYTEKLSSPSKKSKVPKKEWTYSNDLDSDDSDRDMYHTPPIESYNEKDFLEPEYEKELFEDNHFESPSPPLEDSRHRNHFDSYSKQGVDGYIVEEKKDNVEPYREDFFSKETEDLDHNVSIEHEIQPIDYDIHIKKEYKPKEQEDEEDDDELGKWSKDQLESLKIAVSKHDPKDPKYWFLVAKHVHKKSAAECAVKWMGSSVTRKTQKKTTASKKKPQLKSPLRIGDDMTRLKNKKKLRILRDEKEKKQGIDDAFQSPTFSSRHQAVLSMIDDYDSSDNDMEDAVKMINATRDFHEIVTPKKKNPLPKSQKSQGDETDEDDMDSNGSSDSEYSYFLDSSHVDRDKNDKYIYRVRTSSKAEGTGDKGNKSKSKIVTKKDVHKIGTTKSSTGHKTVAKRGHNVMKNKPLNEAIQIIRKMENDERKEQWKEESDEEESGEDSSESF